MPENETNCARVKEGENLKKKAQRNSHKQSKSQFVTLVVKLTSKWQKSSLKQTLHLQLIHQLQEEKSQSLTVVAMIAIQE